MIMTTKLTLLATCLTLCGCKSVTKSFLGSEGGDSGAIAVDSNSVYGKHQLRSMNPTPGFTSIIHPDGTMEMRWIGTNSNYSFPVPLSAPRRASPQWTVPLIIDPNSAPLPTPNSAP